MFKKSARLILKHSLVLAGLLAPAAYVQPSFAAVRCDALFAVSDQGDIDVLNQWLSHFEKIAGTHNPYKGMDLNSDATGRVHLKLWTLFPYYKLIFNKALNEEQVNPAQHMKLKQNSVAELQKAANTRDQDLAFAAKEFVRWLIEREQRLAWQEKVREQQNQDKTQDGQQKDKQQDQNKQQDQKQKQQQGQQQGQQGQQGQQQQDQQNQKQPQDQKKDQKDQQKQDDKKDKQPPKDPWQEDKEDKYRPDNKDINLGQSSGDKKTNVLRTNAFLDPKRFPHYTLFRDKIFDEIDAVEMKERPDWRAPVKRASVASSGSFSEVVTLGKARLRIPVHYGYEPVPGVYKTEGFRVEEIQPGVFDLTSISGALPATVKIPTRATSYDTHAAASKNYTAKSGINPREWPQHIQDGIKIAKEKGGGDPLKIAEILEAYISKEGPYNYYTTTGKELSKEQIAEVDSKLAVLRQSKPMPLALAEVQTFNCDGAAWIHSILLRDFFGLPTRTAGGRGADSAGTVNNEFNLMMTDNAIHHMWVEVYHNGQWVPFDPTPKKNAPQPPDSQNQNDQDMSADRKRNDQDGQNSKDQQGQSQSDGQQQKDQQGKDGQKKDDSSDSKSGQKDGSKDGKDAGDKAADKGDKSSSKDGKGDKASDKDGKADDQKAPDNAPVDADWTQNGVKNRPSVMRQKTPPATNLQSLLKNEILSHQSVELIEAKNREKLTETWLQVVEGDKSLVGNQMVNALRELQSSQSEIFRIGDRTLADVIVQSQTNLIQGKFERVHSDLRILKQSLTALSKVRPLTGAEKKFLDSIQDFLNALKRIRHASAPEHDLVHRFYDNLPGAISKAFVMSRYGEDILTLGTPAQKKLAQDLQKGVLSALVRMSYLKRFVELKLLSENEPRFKDQDIMMRDVTPRKKNDLVIAKSPMEFNRMLFSPNPGEHLFEKLYRGEQFAMGPRETRRVPDPKRTLERKRSVLVYDVSPSMNDGHKVLIQDSLLAAYVDIALSEKDPFGNPLHEVVLVPFNDAVLTSRAIVVKSVDEALHFIQTRSDTSAQTSGSGTDIQAGIMFFYDDLISANLALKPREKRITRANLVLFTDGGSAIDLKAISDKHKSVPKDVKTSFNLISLRESNSDLVDFVEVVRKIVGRSNYFYLDGEKIDHIYEEGQSMKLDADAFATDQKSPTNELVAFYGAVQKSLQKFGDPAQMSDISDLMGHIKVKNQNTDIQKLPSRVIITEFIHVSDALEKNTTMAGQLRLNILMRLLTDYPRMVSRGLEDMTLLEQDAFDRLYRWAMNGR